MHSLSATTTVTLQKRKRPVLDTGVLHLASSPSPSNDAYSESDYEPQPGPSTSTVPISLADAASKSCSKRRFSCSYAGCQKSYTKPCRLAEHERSHTGDRPFVCQACDKSYLREAHLQAHARSHLSYSERPFTCVEPGCAKRFWTAQHLRVHSELHTGDKPFKCAEASCAAAFMKHHQLREHTCTVHCPPGTKPYRCEHPGCSKSFATNQKLRTHSKTHDDKRYTCSHSTCLGETDATPVYYQTWTALQHHMRTAHPPVCPYSSCNGKTFSTQKGLRAHLKIHEQREVEDNLTASESGSDIDEPPRKRRRGGQIGRDWVCDIDDCTKDFKSKKALTTHQNVSHLGRRDFVCPHETCGRAFGYKHLLQRHLAKLHAPPADHSSQSGDSSSDDDEQPPAIAAKKASLSIDDITGRSYAVRSYRMLAQPHTLRCPYPNIHELVDDVHPPAPQSCEYVFSRAYDFKRHLHSEHSIEVDRERVDAWVKTAKKAKETLRN